MFRVVARKSLQIAAFVCLLLLIVCGWLYASGLANGSADIEVTTSSRQRIASNTALFRPGASSRFKLSCHPRQNDTEISLSRTRTPAPGETGPAKPKVSWSYGPTLRYYFTDYGSEEHAALITKLPVILVLLGILPLCVFGFMPLRSWLQESRRHVCTVCGTAIVGGVADNCRKCGTRFDVTSPRQSQPRWWHNDSPRSISLMRNMVLILVRFVVLVFATLFAIILLLTVIPLVYGDSGLTLHTGLGYLARGMPPEHASRKHGWTDSHYSLAVDSKQGPMVILLGRIRQFDQGAAPGYAGSVPYIAKTPAVVFPFVTYVNEVSPKYDRVTIRVNLFIAMVVLGFFPFVVLVIVPIIRWRRRYRGGCRKCGYDLRGNTSGVCPECGEQFVRGVSSDADLA